MIHSKYSSFQKYLRYFREVYLEHCHCTKRMKFFIQDFFSKNDQIHRKLQIWSHLPIKSLMENFIFLCSVSNISDEGFPKKYFTAEINIPLTIWPCSFITKKRRSRWRLKRSFFVHSLWCQHPAKFSAISFVQVEI